MKILEIVTSVSFLFSIIRMTTPILYASMSYLVADLAGVTNIGIEGMMLTCALIGVVASAAFGGNAFSWLYGGRRRRRIAGNFNVLYCY